MLGAPASSRLVGEAHATTLRVVMGTSFPAGPAGSRPGQHAAQRRRAEHGTDPIACRRCQIPMVFIGAIFGSHAKIAQYFEAAGIPTTPSHPAWDTG